MTRCFARAALAILVGAVLWAFPAPAAHARSLSMEQLDVELSVGEDGILTVTERLRVRFDGSWNGIFRTIPYVDRVRFGVRRSLVLRVDTVEDASGRALEYWKSKTGNRLKLKIRVPGASNATRDVVIRYRALNVLLAYEAEDSEFGGHDELYWNVVGGEWEFPIERVTCTVRLPDAIVALGDEHVRTRTYRGVYGGSQPGPELERRDDGTYALADDARYQVGEYLTVAVAFPPGHIEHPGFGTRVLWFVQVNWFIFIPILALLLWFVLWWTRGRDAMRGRVVIPEFEAPAGLGAAEVGVLLDETLHPHDVTAGILDLAVRGLITVHVSDKRRTLELHRDRLTHAELSAVDRRLIDGVFGDDRTKRRLSSLKYGFVRELDRLKTLAEKELVGHGFWREKPSSTKNAWTGITLLAALVLGGLTFVFGPLYAFVMIPCVIGMFIIARQMSRRTPKGMDALARVMGMQEYMVTAERDRMKSLPMDMFEKLLPFAVAFGLHDRWLEAFASLYEQDPSWIAREGAYQGSLLHTLDGLDGDVSKNLYSGPRPPKSSGGSGGWSGGSGFSGGGFSGGGFGGGGGGGW